MIVNTVTKNANAKYKIIDILKHALVGKQNTKMMCHAWPTKEATS